VEEEWETVDNFQGQEAAVGIDAMGGGGKNLQRRDDRKAWSFFTIQPF